MQEIIQFSGNHIILSMAWLTLLIAVIFATFQSLVSNNSKITCNEAIQLINKEDAIVIDLRNNNQFRNGHIINSINLTLNDIKNGSLGKLPGTKNKPIIIVCTNGTVTSYQLGVLNNTSLQRVYILKEGIVGWIKESLPLVRSI